MDVQLKRGFLDICVLSSLLKEESYGYKIIKDLSDQRIDISESTLYPILRRLETAGALTVQSREHNGRLRKFYSITRGGRAQLKEFLEDWGKITAMYDFIKGGIEDDKDGIYVCPPGGSSAPSAI